MPHLSRLALPTYAVCLWLVLFSAIDAALLTLPLSPTMAMWRYGLARLVNLYLLSPMIGIFLALVLAVVFEHSRVLKAVSMISGLAAIIMLVLTIVYFVDSFAMRGVEQQGLIPPFTGRWALDLVKLIFGAGLFGVFATAARALSTGAPATGKTAPGVVGR